MDEQTPHIHIEFVPFICNSKRGLDTRVSLKGALSEQGFKGGTRGMTEWNDWIETVKRELSKVMGRHGAQWKQLGTQNKHVSVLDFEKQERQGRKRSRYGKRAKQSGRKYRNFPLQIFF